jgi:hypothetical protein
MTELVSTKEVDYLDEDKPIRGQNYVLVSFLSPEDVIINKDVYFFSKFIEKFSNDMKSFIDIIKEKYPEQKDMINTIEENNNYIFNYKELNEQYNFYKSVSSEELEKKFHVDNNFTTSIRGIKVRGTFDTIDEAKNRCEFLKKIDSKFNIYIAQVGCWCPWSPNPECLENQEYAETQLNTLMKEYKNNMDNRDIIFESRKQSIASNAANVPSEDKTEVADKENIINNIELSHIKEEIEKIDPWSSRNT